MVRDVPSIVRYGIAIILGLLATMAALALEDSTGTTYYWPFFAAVILAAWFSGFGPGVMVTGICIAAIDYYFEHPAYAWQISGPKMAIRLFGFAITAFVICTLTEQRREAYRREAHARRTAEDALRLRDLLLATVAHDLKSPVGVILMRTQLLQRRLDHGTVADFAAVQAGLTSIESTAQRIMGIIDHQLDIARVVSDQAIPLDSRPLDLVTLIREKVHEWQETADEHAIVFATTLPSLTGRWDAARLERVLDNLLSNAIKYSPMGGTITVTLARERHPQEDEIVITVQDEGIGIPAADIPKIFTPFHRAGNVVNVVAGNGVGLASARALVEQYGGTISVTSTERQGTTFTIRLPIAH